MDSFLFLSSVIVFIEKRIKGKIDYKELAVETGFSLPYIRELFASKMRKPLSRYILERKIANAAFEIKYTNKTLLCIATEYNFNNADSFTRAFKRIVGVTPSEFRKLEIVMKRVKLSAGVYGIALPTPDKNQNLKG